MKDLRSAGDGWRQWYKMGGMKTTIAALFDPQNAQQTAFIRSLMKEQRKKQLQEMPLNRMEAVVFDLETTGFSPYHGDEILSFGAVAVSGKEIKPSETFYSLVNPNRSIPEPIQELTAITNGMAAASPVLIDVLGRFFQFVQGRTLIAHGSGHDKRFLNAALWKTSKARLTHRLLDTMLIVKRVHPKWEDYGLDSVLQAYQIPITGRHHALDDARMTAELWNRLVDEMEANGISTLGDLYTYLSLY